jgi:plastocyanin/heme-degrading monooxygenase HmoA
MSHPTADHGEHGAPHLPDPSIWPLVAGAATLALGLALVWWSRDRANSVSGPLMGAAALFTLVSVAGWATEDSRMRRKAERRELTRPREARYTQVVTFAIAQGQLAAARAAAGVLTAVEGTDGALHNLAGFQDLRIILSPDDNGPTQVLVETTWSDREGLATYEETRKTLLDLLTAHVEEVVSGSINVFDMQVIRDTKEVGFKFGVAAASVILGAFIVGGFMIGAGLTTFQKESKASAEAAPAAAGPAAPAGTVDMIATDNKFSKGSIDAEAGKELTVNFKNSGKVPHNLHFLDKKGGATLTGTTAGEIVTGGGGYAIKFTPSAGTYYYQCDVHPDQMFGTLNVK